VIGRTIGSVRPPVTAEKVGSARRARSEAYRHCCGRPQRACRRAIKVGVGLSVVLSGPTRGLRLTADALFSPEPGYGDGPNAEGHPHRLRLPGLSSPCGTGAIMHRTKTSRLLSGIGSSAYCADVGSRTFRSLAEITWPHVLWRMLRRTRFPHSWIRLCDECMFDALERLSARRNVKSVDAAKAVCYGLDGR
jgi:hypothetical protein